MAKEKATRGNIKSIDDFQKMFAHRRVDVREAAKAHGVWPTGSLKVDALLGGGIPKGKMTEIYGPPGCLAADTHIPYIVRAGDGQKRNGKGGTIERLYERFHKIPRAGRGYYARPTEADSIYYAPSVNEDGQIILNRIVNVVKSGEKECFLLTTESGEAIKATADHKFWVGDRFVALGELTVGDTVFVHTKTPQSRQTDTPRMHRAEVFVKHHPIAAEKVIEGKYVYRRLRRSRAVVEAQMNGLVYEDYIARLNSGDLEGLIFLPREKQVHHLDEDVTNDSPENLAVLSIEEHARLHGLDPKRQLRFVAVATTIVSIVPVGVQETYDIQMEAPYNNFVAEGIVVHNSGKSTLALKIISLALKAGVRCAYHDLEKGLDLRDDTISEDGFIPEQLLDATETSEDAEKRKESRQSWLRINGIDPLDENLYIYEPYTGEELFTMLGEGLPFFGLQIVDSVPAIMPAKVMDGLPGEATYGSRAKLLAEELPRLLRMWGTLDSSIIFINQVRENIGAQVKSQKATGGFALDHYVRCKIKTQRTFRKDQGDDVITESRIKVEKNIYGSNREEIIRISGKRGIDTLHELLEFAVDFGYIKMSGNWHYVFDIPTTDEDFKAAQAKKKIAELPGYLAGLNGEGAALDWMMKNGWEDRLYPLAAKAMGV